MAKIPTLFQAFIRKRRQQLGMNQAEVALAIGVASPEFIALVEGGNRNLQMERVFRLADVLRVDRQDLIKMAMYEQLPMTYRVMFGDNLPPGSPCELEQVRSNVQTIQECIPMLNKEQLESIRVILNNMTGSPIPALQL